MEDQRYVIEGSVQQRYVGMRDAQTFLPFLLPHLKPGLDVLDAGCGVGSIALDLAPTIAPGRIAGIDVDPEQIEVARTTAAQRGIDNAEFAAASVYELPFDDASFDAVYANAVLFYLSEPLRALVEFKRVLRPGGLAAVSDDDLGTVVISPDRPELELAPRLFECAVEHEGGNGRYSRHLRTLMLEAGFVPYRGNRPRARGLRRPRADALVRRVRGRPVQCRGNGQGDRRRGLGDPNRARRRAGRAP